jgi:hypothetical protein
VQVLTTLALSWSATCGAAVPADLDPAAVLAGAHEQKVTASDGGHGQNFGYAVAIDGDTAAICAYVATVDGNMFQGAVYLFDRIDGAWTETRKLTASDGAAFGQFGESLALEGDTLLVGSNGADGFRGAVYVFERSAAGWQETAKLLAGDGAGADNFGWSVSIKGSTAVVGAPYADVDGNADQGAAYVFTRAGGVWSETQKLVSGDGAAGDEFGRDVDNSGAVALIGAPQASVAGSPGQGGAYVFVADGACGTRRASSSRATAVKSTASARQSRCPDPQPPRWWARPSRPLPTCSRTTRADGAKRRSSSRARDRSPATTSDMRWIWMATRRSSAR